VLDGTGYGQEARRAEVLPLLIEVLPDAGEELVAARAVTFVPNVGYACVSTIDQESVAETRCFRGSTRLCEKPQPC
jgi:hypothetical protein